MAKKRKPQSRSKVQRPKRPTLVRPTKGPTRKQTVARNKGKKQQPPGEYETKQVYRDANENDFADIEHTQPLSAADLLGWEEHGKPKPGGGGNSVQEYRKFKPYDDPQPPISSF